MSDCSQLATAASGANEIAVWWRVFDCVELFLLAARGEIMKFAWPEDHITLPPS
jgi:hypothetical protein